MTKEEFELWQAKTESSRFKWTEDEIFRLNGRGVFYYIGGEDGQFIKAHNDGRLEVGKYEDAFPHIGEALFKTDATKQCKDFNDAFETAVKVGGKKFLVDMFSGGDIGDYRRSKVEKDAETPEKSEDKPLTGMAKLRASEKEKRESPVPLVQKDKSDRRKSDLDL